MKFPDRQPPQWDHPSFTFKTPCSKAFAWLFSSQSIPFLRLCLSEFWSGLKYYLKKSYHYKNSTITQQQKIGKKKKMQLHKTKKTKTKRDQVLILMTNCFTTMSQTYTWPSQFWFILKLKVKHSMPCQRWRETRTGRSRDKNAIASTRNKQRQWNIRNEVTYILLFILQPWAEKK